MNNEIKNAAYHEAGHTIIAMYSKYHFILHEISINNYGFGITYVTVSKKKCGKEKVDIPNLSNLPDFIKEEYILILLAGYATEKLASEKDKSIILTKSPSDIDNNTAKDLIKTIDNSKKLASYELMTDDLVKSNWDKIDKLASKLIVRNTIESVDVLDLFNYDF